MGPPQALCRSQNMGDTLLWSDKKVRKRSNHRKKSSRTDSIWIRNKCGNLILEQRIDNNTFTRHVSIILFISIQLA